MADPVSSQLAALLLQQQRRSVDPADSSRRFAQALMQRGMSTEPVRSPIEGLARMLQGGVAGYFEGEAERKQKTRDQNTIKGLSDYAAAPAGPEGDEARKIARGLLGEGELTMVAPFLMQEAADKRALGAAQRSLGSMPPIGGGAPGAGGGAPAQPGQRPLTIDIRPNPPPQGDTPLPGIPALESGGRYDAIGPVANGQGQRAYGKYQVMDFNIPVWTKEVLGREMTPQEFLASPQAQDAVYRAKIGQYRQQTGSDQGAAAMWFSGQPNPQSAARDVNGVDVAQYVNRTVGPGGAPQAPAQGSAQGPAAAPPAQTAPPATVPRETPQAPEISPQALELQRQAQELAKTGTVEALTQARALQAKALEAQAAWVQDRTKTADQRAFEQSQDTRKRELDQPQQDFTNSGKLRGDFDSQPVVKAYRVVVPMLESAKDAATRPTRAADINLIYAFAKLMDPDSVVRESETGMVTASASVSDRLQGIIGQLNGGQMLQPETRQRLIAELQSRFNSLEQSYKTMEGQYAGIAERGRLNRDDVIVPIRPQQPNTTTMPAADLKKKYGLE